MRRSPAAVGFAADRLNRLQFLTIRRYLSLVFAALVVAAPGARAMAVIVDLVVQGAQMLLVLLLAPLLTGFVRKVKARLLRRRGPPLLQPYRDLLRLLRKEVVLAENASWLFRVAPYLIFAATWVAAALVPTFATGLLFSWSADLIAIIALLGSARFFLALAGMDVGTSFGGIGSSREVMIASLAEPAMIMIVFTLALVAGSTQLSTVADFMLSPEVGLRVSLGLALVALIMVAIAENARIPVDNPATHLELTMVHEAMVLEYSGRHLAVIELAASLKLLLYVSLIACVFVPWGLAPAGAGAGALRDRASPPISASSRSAASCSRCSRPSIAKMRVFRVPEFLGAALMLGLLGTLLLFVSRSFCDATVSPSTSPICSPAAWCWSASCCSTRTASTRCSTSSRCTRSCWRCRSPGRPTSRTRRISTSPPRSRSSSRRSSFRSRCTGSSCGSASIARSRRSVGIGPTMLARHGAGRAVDGGDAAR